MTAIGEVLGKARPDAEATRVYGMFAHGELGPETFSGFVDAPAEDKASVACTQHSMTSILAVHTAREGAKDEV